MIGNVFGGKKGGGTFQPTELALGDFEVYVPHKQTVDDHRVMVNILAEAFNAKRVKRGNN
jgi:hypothetical protein